MAAAGCPWRGKPVRRVYLPDADDEYAGAAAAGSMISTTKLLELLDDPARDWRCAYQAYIR